MAGVATCVAVAVPMARNTRYPVTPVTTFQVSSTPSVRVPSVAARPDGAGSVGPRQPVSALLAAESPPVPALFTV